MQGIFPAAQATRPTLLFRLPDHPFDFTSSVQGGPALSRRRSLALGRRTAEAYDGHRANLDAERRIG
jgi:hypothetical protein